MAPKQSFIFSGINKDFYQGLAHERLAQDKEFKRVFHKNFPKRSNYSSFEYQWATKFFHLKNYSDELQLFSDEKTPIRLKSIGSNLSQIRFFDQIDQKKSQWQSIQPGHWKVAYKDYRLTKEVNDYFSFIEALVEYIPTIRFSQEVFFARYTNLVERKNDSWLSLLYSFDYFNYHQLNGIKLPFNRKFSKKYYQKSVEHLWNYLKDHHQRNNLHNRSLAQKHFHFIQKGAGRWHPQSKKTSK